MGGGRARATYAYRDLDEEAYFPSLLEHAYHSQESPLPKPLSESVILRTHFDKTRRALRRQIALAVGIVLLFGASALLLLAATVGAQSQPHPHRSSLELAIAAPYSALRGNSGTSNANLVRSVPFDSEFDGYRSIVAGPSVGDADPHDAIAAAAAVTDASVRTTTTTAASVDIAIDNESNELFYGDADVTMTTTTHNTINNENESDHTTYEHTIEDDVTRLAPTVEAN